MDNTSEAHQKPLRDPTARPGPLPVPVVAEYFERPEGAPSIFTLLLALDGVCSALEAEQVSFSDHDQIERMEGMGVAAAVLARQLRGRYYGSKPPSKRQLEKVRKAQPEWTETMREKLAGPAQEYLRAANAIQQTEGNA